ncbi:hypothetical protein BJP35_0018 [Enterobacter sp. J49]|uniref:hypothetical protein n=1 Tax=Enterobacter sp. J49 TaxID=1903627 RepID=UPI000A3BF2B2|nr:hypothetical protein [Enterobacter sp. J49]OUC39430.1 hypothetical protein BJP35_0018 [Enterobacter sp. J49]
MYKVIGLLIVSGLLTACQSPHDEDPVNRTNSLNRPDEQRLELSFCTRELESLHQVSQTAWHKRNTELANILTQERVYRNVRSNISESSVTIMDAAYNYKISRVCNDIRNDLTRELVEKVEHAYPPRSGSLFQSSVKTQSEQD